jgi:hypothetical protein
MSKKILPRPVSRDTIFTNILNLYDRKCCNCGIFIPRPSIFIVQITARKASLKEAIFGKCSAPQCNQKNYFCPFCEIVTKAPHLLRNHVKIVHNSLQCNLCKFNFQSWETLYVHSIYDHWKIIIQNLSNQSNVHSSLQHTHDNSALTISNIETDQTQTSFIEIHYDYDMMFRIESNQSSYYLKSILNSDSFDNLPQLPEPLHQFNDFGPFENEYKFKFIIY